VAYIEKKIENHTEFRNHLAHFSIHELPSTDGELRLCLRPTLFDVRYIPYINQPKPKPQQYSYKEITETGEAFLCLYREIVNFGIETGAILPPAASSRPLPG
jgi:hypothetical protein